MTFKGYEARNQRSGFAPIIITDCPDNPSKFLCTSYDFLVKSCPIYKQHQQFDNNSFPVTVIILGTEVY